MFVNKSSLLRNNPSQLNYGIAVADLDGDAATVPLRAADGGPGALASPFEIVVAGFGAPNLVLKWDGAGFVDIADETLADAGMNAIGVAAADINGDGREELYILNTDTFAGAKRFGDRLFLFRGRRWVDLFALEENRRALNLTAGRSVACIDRDGRGIYSFIVANYGGPLRLYALNARGLLADHAREAGVGLVTGGRSLLALPLVSGRADIFAGNENGPNFLFVNRGDGSFDERAAAFGVDDPFQHARGVAALDADQDGRFDLALGNWEGGHRLFVRAPDGRFIDRAPSDMARPSRVRTVIAADFDNDGYEELFFNNIGEPNRLFGWRDGRWTALPIGDALEPTGLGTGAAVGDFDSDGRLELLIAHGESGAAPLSVYKADEAATRGHHWLRAMPLTRYGAPARGAVVRLLGLDGRAQIRAIDAGSGYLCQMEPVAHFGLGALDGVAHIEITWPDGAVRRLERPAANQLLRVEHPRASA
jgi:hypothetical protein